MNQSIWLRPAALARGLRRANEAASKAVRPDTASPARLATHKLARPRADDGLIHNLSDATDAAQDRQRVEEDRQREQRIDALGDDAETGRKETTDIPAPCWSNQQVPQEAV